MDSLKMTPKTTSELLPVVRNNCGTKCNILQMRV